MSILVEFILRRGGISYGRDDKAAKYVRMLGDIKNSINDMQNIELGSRVPLKRRYSLPERDVKLLQGLNHDSRCKALSTRTRSSSLCRVHKYSRKSEKKSRHHVANRESIHLDGQYPGQIKKLVSNNIGRWDFDIFHLEQITAGHPLEPVVMELFQKYDLIRTFRLDSLQLRRCIGLIHKGYYNVNPYHNATHAADVTQAMHCYIHDQKLFSNLQPIEIMSALLAAMTHDLDHPGVNQVFLITCKHHLASLYKQNSVLENHHFRAAISLIRECGVFNHLPKSEWNNIKRLIRELILATDIARQAEFLKKFEEHLNQKTLHMEANSSHRLFVLQIALKCADICNPCRKWEVSSRWSRMIVREFFGQGDQERRLGLQVSELNDRTKNTCAKIQDGFIRFVVEPLFELWNRFQPSQLSKYMLENARSNQKRWIEIKQKEAEKKEKALNERQEEQLEVKNGTNLKERTLNVERKEKQTEPVCNGHVVKLQKTDTEHPISETNQVLTQDLKTHNLKDIMTQTSTCNSDTKATQTNQNVLKQTSTLPTKQHSLDHLHTNVVGYSGLSRSNTSHPHADVPTLSNQLATPLRTNSEEVIPPDTDLHVSKVYQPVERKRSNTNVDMHRDVSNLLPLRLQKISNPHTIKSFEDPWRRRDLDQDRSLTYKFQGLNNNVVGKYAPDAKSENTGKPSVSFRLGTHLHSQMDSRSSPSFDYLRSSPSNLGSPAIKKRMHELNIRRIDMRFQGDLSPRPRRKGEYGYLGAFEPLVQQFALDQRRKVQEFQQQRKDVSVPLRSNLSGSQSTGDSLQLPRNGSVASRVRQMDPNL
ncbi:high affinity cAMP-specific 3',5'-cyclic phosphodiesterase 7A-like isoform X2 [Anneissia japonica]|uniref:high affinity cAMP-specific 3',5'-cyclic phosphodiesterase 7A-like isoform X2 n=1 Tax=Anneissia japonica TaxID=1529436 RepID=UPI0014258BC4|nr:high affinity cAMP-specific 3',5'-cyclic phosphodiesterase 7A-like isoform X2 [Anneissia japonica]